MKALKTLMAIALSAVGLGSAVTLGIVANNEKVEEVNATVWRQNPTIYFVPSSNWSQSSATFKMNYYDNSTYKGKITAVDTGKTYNSEKIYECKVTDGTWVSAVQFLRMDSTGNTQWNYSGTFDISDDYDSGVNSLLMNKTFATYDSWTTSSNGVGWEELSDLVETYTITKMAVEFIDGVAQTPADWSLGSDTVIDGETYTPNDPTQRNLEHFEGWYTNPACTTAYTAQAITGNMTIYAKFTRLTVDSYVYYIAGSTPAFSHVYFFGDYTNNNDWPGTALSTYATEVHGVFSFEGTSQSIYKIPVPSTGDFKFILTDGQTSNAEQTYDIDVTPGAGYWVWKESNETKYSWTANADAGAAIDLIIDVEAKRNAVSASGSVLNYSVCGISSVDAAALYNRYIALSANAKGFVDSSTTYTYDGAYDGVNVPEQDNISYADIMAQLRAIAIKGNQVVNDANIIKGVKDNNNALLIITIVAILTVSGTGTFFLLRKKRKEQ